ncbi:anthranilate O-methyltransferase 3-like [Zingiber officinale]|uniref:anthranilate O-methyltransferase 3-like n=1 Tax=Zingiber officinale TaxID=94328 RepID=UPI001C4BE163|nr:anthranilate O-methyltransferase 3-like [Zingiber officinale]
MCRQLLHFYWEPEDPKEDPDESEEDSEDPEESEHDLEECVEDPIENLEAILPEITPNEFRLKGIILTTILVIINMIRGAGETSYATNSRLQEKAIYRTKPVSTNAIEEVYKKLLPEHMVIVDLGCSSGPNTFIVVSQVLNIIIELRRMMEMNKPLDVQFLLNDLLGNDFNYVFQSLHKFKKKVEEETKGELLVPYYVVGVPRSFYGRLFPRASVHFFYSSYSLMWLSQVPKELENEQDPFDDSQDHSFNFALPNYTKSAKNVADCIRAVLEPLIVHQFGDVILDDLFTRYTHNVSKHLIKEKSNHTILVFALKKCI